jgi:NADH-quinone oxidoreductase subunit B
MEGLTLLREAVGNEKRPLSWVAGPQGIEPGPRPSQRDLKRAERQQETTLRTPDQV